MHGTLGSRPGVETTSPLECTFVVRPGGTWPGMVYDLIAVASMIRGCRCRLFHALLSQSFCSLGAVAKIHGAETASPCRKSSLEGLLACVQT